MTTLADMRPFAGKISGDTRAPQPADDDRVLGSREHDGDSSPAQPPQILVGTGAGNNLVAPGVKAEMSAVLQQNSLIFTGQPQAGMAEDLVARDAFKVVKREFTNAMGELQVDRQWRGGIVSKTEQKTTLVEDEDGKKKKKRN